MIVLLLAPPTLVRDQDETKPSHPAETKAVTERGKGKWVPLFQRHADGYVIRTGPDARGKTRRLPEPLLRWWQPVRGGDDGALYLWVREGRAVAAGTFFTFKWPNGNRSIVHERHSFAAEPLEAEWRGDSVWKTTRPGLTFQPVPEAPAPAPTPSARLRQMQGMAREFSGQTTDEKNSNWPLRVLTRPLYRYEGKIDGALFGMVQGTEPEAFLFLEVRGEGREARWEYAVARFTDLKIQVRCHGREVFSGPNTTGARGEIYHSTTVLNKPSDTSSDFD